MRVIPEWNWQGCKWHENHENEKYENENQTIDSKNATIRWTTYTLMLNIQEFKLLYQHVDNLW